MDYDAVAWLERRRWEPLRHAVRSVAGQFVSLCGSLDTRLWTRGKPLRVRSKWLVDPNCPGCLRALRRARAGAMAEEE